NPCAERRVGKAQHRIRRTNYRWHWEALGNPGNGKKYRHGQSQGELQRGSVRNRVLDREVAIPIAARQSCLGFAPASQRCALFVREYKLPKGFAETTGPSGSKDAIGRHSLTFLISPS